jgi:hypothetical protein
MNMNYYFVQLIAYTPHFEKKKKQKYAYAITMLSVSVYPPPATFECLNRSL